MWLVLPFWTAQAWSIAIMAESSIGNRTALYLPEPQLMDFLFVFAVQLSASGSEVYSHEENLQELPRIVTCLNP